MTKEINYKEIIEVDRTAKFQDAKFYQEVLKKAKKDFSRGYKFISNGIDAENATGSNFFFVCLADEMLGDLENIVTINDWGHILKVENPLVGLYVDSNQLVLRSNEDSHNKNKFIINDLSKRLGKEGINYFPENPALITRPIIRSSKEGNNEYGINVRFNRKTEISNDARLAYGNDSIMLGDKKKNLWTKSEGISGVCLGETNLVSSILGLAGSGSGGRTVSIDAGGIQSFRNVLQNPLPKVQ